MNTVNLFGQENHILMSQHVIQRLSFKATAGLKKQDHNEIERLCIVAFNKALSQFYWKCGIKNISVLTL